MIPHCYYSLFSVSERFPLIFIQKKEEKEKICTCKLVKVVWRVEILKI